MKMDRIAPYISLTIALAGLLVLASPESQIKEKHEQSSRERLKALPLKHPDAAPNGDGVLSANELRAPGRTWKAAEARIENMKSQAAPLAPDGALPRPAEKRDYFVSPVGSDGGDGTREKPFRTIARGVSVLGPGAKLYLREGTYHEELRIKGLKGVEGAPITISPYKNEKVILDGTIALDNLEWTKHRTLANVWCAQIERDVWQLFVNGRMMINARWPNAEHPFENEEHSSWWDRSRSWRTVQYKIGDRVVSGFDFDRARGFLVDDGAGHGLADMRRSFNGCIGVLNVNSMDTLVGRIVEHKAGSPNFEYEVNKDLQRDVRDPRQNNLRRILTKNASHAYYYFEGGADLIDTPDEWAYEKETKTLFLFGKDADELKAKKIRGKVQTAALHLDGCRYVTVRGLNFFATCLQAIDCAHATVEDNFFDYPSYSRRMLGSLESIQVITLEGGQGRQAAREGRDVTGNVFRNNIVQKTDGRGLHLEKGSCDVVDNNYFRYIDISGTPGGTVGVWATGWRNRFSRNTLEICGSSKATKCGDSGLITLNRISRFGYLQDDGTAFQAAGEGQQGTIYLQNWAHDSPKSGMRFDGSEDADAYAKGIYNGSMVRNVVFNNNGGLMVKGDDHRVYNNLCYKTAADAYKILTSSLSPNSNHHTIARNNIGDFMNASRRDNPVDNPPPGPTDHNWVNQYPQRDIRELLRDPDNLDFRPRAGASEIIDAGADIPAEKLRCGALIPDFTSEFKIGEAPDIGPYEFGARDYWIPGYRGPKASTPIPPDGCLTAKIDADLIWLGAYRAESYRVYLGTDPDDLKLVCEQSNNICSPGPLDPTLVYYWRVDSKTPDGWSRGDLWHFRARGRLFRPGGAPASYVAAFGEAYDFDQNNLEKNARGLLMPWIRPKYNGDHLDIRDGAMEVVPNFSRFHDFEPISIPNINIDLERYPFVSFRYKTTARSKPTGLYLGYERPGGGNQRVFPERALATLAPNPKQFASVRLSLEQIVAEGKKKFGSALAKDFLLQINGPADAPWGKGDGAFVIADFKIGFACLLDTIERVEISGQRFPIESMGQPVVVSPEDLKIQVTIKNDPNKYAFPPGEPFPGDWGFSLGTCENCTIIDGDTVKPLSGFKGVLIIPATITAGNLKSPAYSVEIHVR